MLSIINTHNQVKSTKIPTPYGSIPKRNKKSSSNKKINATPLCRKNSIPSAPYPCFSLTPTSTTFFFSVFNSLFKNKAVKEEKPVGFMPRSSDKIQMSQIVDIAVSSNSIDCNYGGGKEPETCSNSSSSSESSSLGSLFSYYMDSMEDDMTHNNTSTNSACNSTEILSDILCDHYVQAQLNKPPSLSDNIVTEVPLETFRVFEAPNSSITTEGTANPIYDNWMSIDVLSTKEWKLIETKKEIQQKTNEIIVQTQKEEVITPVETSEVSPDTMYRTRDIRANAAYLRIIVAEVNMMRSQKITGPLRPRRVLPKRLDSFVHRPSPLQSIAV